MEHSLGASWVQNENAIEVENAVCFEVHESLCSFENAAFFEGNEPLFSEAETQLQLLEVSIGRVHASGKRADRVESGSELSLKDLNPLFNTLSEG